MRALLIVFMTALAFGLAACGSDDDDDGGGATTKADFIEQADAICARVNSQIGEINEEVQGVTGSEKQKLAKLAPIFERAATTQDDAIEEFRELEPPAEDEDLIDRYLDAAEEQSEVLRGMAEGADAGDAKAYASAARKLPEISEKRRQLIADYGFEQCGGESSS